MLRPVCILAQYAYWPGPVCILGPSSVCKTGRASMHTGLLYLRPVCILDEYAYWPISLTHPVCILPGYAYWVASVDEYAYWSD